MGLITVAVKIVSLIAYLGLCSHSRVFTVADAEEARHSFPNSQLVNLSLSRPYGINALLVQNPTTNHSMRMGLLNHNSVSLRPEWKSVHAVKNVLAPSECELIIMAAEEYAKKNGGWLSSRHDTYPTTDLPMKSVFDEGMNGLIERTVTAAVFPKYKEFGVDPSSFYVIDLFIVKYDSNGQKDLAPHRDASPWSFVVSLNDNYEGGGTYFTESNDIYKAGRGHAVLFSGKNEHAGVPVTAGVRYILAGFVNFGTVINDFRDGLIGNGLHRPDITNLNFNRSYYNPVHDGYAAMNGFQSGDIIVGLEFCEYVARSLSSMKDEVGTGTSDVNGNINANGEVLVRTIVTVDSSMTDEEWKAIAFSCESLLPLDEKVKMVVSRRNNIVN